MENNIILELKQEIMDLKEELNKLRRLESAETNELAAALAKAQGEFTVAGKSRENPFFKSSYASYEDLVAATRPALTKYGLSVQTCIISRSEKQYARIILRHSSGQYTTSESIINPVKNDPQSEGSCRSYKHRYGYKEITGVVVSEDSDDDDGEATMIRSTTLHSNNPYITKEQIEILENELKGDNDLKYDMLEKLKLESLAKITKSSFNSILTRVREIKSLK